MSKSNSGKQYIISSGGGKRGERGDGTVSIKQIEQINKRQDVESRETPTFVLCPRRIDITILASTYFIPSRLNVDNVDHLVLYTGRVTPYYTALANKYYTASNRT